MKDRSPFRSMSVEARARSIGHALHGIRLLFTTQPNFLLHLAATIAVIVLGIFFRISLLEWALVVICIGAVLASEAFNTALEFLADALEPDHNPLIGRAKDVAAGAVLMTSVGAAVVGLLIFVPHITRTIQG